MESTNLDFGKTKVIVYERPEKEGFKGTVSISPSSLRRSCPYFQTLAALKKPEQRSPDKNLTIGKNYHEKIERFLATEDPVYLEGFPKTTINPLKRILLRIKSMAAGGVLEIERGLKMEYKEPSIVVRGYMDIFLRKKEFPAYISDAKSFDRISELKNEEKKQLLFYMGLVAASDEIEKEEKKKLLSSILRIKAGKLVEGPEMTLEQAKEYYEGELLPLAKNTGKKIHEWIEKYKKGENPPAVPGPQCKICPYIFTCPLLKRVPKSEEDIAAQFIVIDALHSYTRDVLRGKTVILPEAVIYTKLNEWETIPGKNFAYILDLMNKLDNEYQRASFFEKIAELTTGISSYRLEKAHRLTIDLIELLIAQKREKLSRAKEEEEEKKLQREIKILENFSFENLKETSSKTEIGITTPEDYKSKVLEKMGEENAIN